MKNFQFYLDMRGLKFKSGDLTGITLAYVDMLDSLAEHIEGQKEVIKNCNDNNELNAGHLLALQDRIKKLEEAVERLEKKIKRPIRNSSCDY